MIRKSGNRFSEKIMLKQKDTLESDSTWLNQTPAYPDRAVRGRVAGQQENGAPFRFDRNGKGSGFRDLSQARKHRIN